MRAAMRAAMRVALLGLPVCAVGSHMRVDADAAAAASAASATAPAPAVHNLGLYVKASMAQLAAKATSAGDLRLAHAAKRRLRLQARYDKMQSKRAEMKRRIEAMKFSFLQDRAGSNATARVVATLGMKDCTDDQNCYEQNAQKLQKATATLTQYNADASGRESIISGNFGSSLRSKQSVVSGHVQRMSAGMSKNLAMFERNVMGSEDKLVGVATPAEAAAKRASENAKTNIMLTEEAFDPGFTDEADTISKQFKGEYNTLTAAAEKAAHESVMLMTGFYDTGATQMVKTAGEAERNAIQRETKLAIHNGIHEDTHDKLVNKLELILEEAEAREEHTDEFAEEAASKSEELKEGSNPNEPSLEFQAEVAQEGLADVAEEGADAVATMNEDMEYTNENFDDLVADESGDSFEKMDDELAAASDVVSDANRNARLNFKKVALEMDTGTEKQLALVGDANTQLSIADLAIHRQFGALKELDKDIEMQLANTHSEKIGEADRMSTKLSYERQQEENNLDVQLKADFDNVDLDTENRHDGELDRMSDQLRDASTVVNSQLEQDAVTLEQEQSAFRENMAKLDEGHRATIEHLAAVNSLRQFAMKTEDKLRYIVEFVDQAQLDMDADQRHQAGLLEDARKAQVDQVRDTKQAALDFIKTAKDSLQVELSRFQAATDTSLQDFEDNSALKNQNLNAKIMRSAQAIEDRTFELANAMQSLTDIKNLSREMVVNMVDELKNIAYEFSILPRALEGNVTALMEDARGRNSVGIANAEAIVMQSQKQSKGRMMKEFAEIQSDLGLAASSQETAKAETHKDFTTLAGLTAGVRKQMTEAEARTKQVYKQLREGPVASLSKIHKVLDEIDGTAQANFAKKEEDWQKRILDASKAFNVERAKMKKQYLDEVNANLMAMGTAGADAFGDVNNAKGQDQTAYASLLAEARAVVTKTGSAVGNLGAEISDNPGRDVIAGARAAVVQEQAGATQLRSGYDAVLHALDGFEKGLDAKFAGSAGAEQGALNHLLSTVQGAINQGEMDEARGQSLMNEALRQAKLTFSEREAEQHARLVQTNKDLLAEERSVAEGAAKTSQEMTAEEQKIKAAFMGDMLKLALNENAQDDRLEREAAEAQAVTDDITRQKLLLEKEAASKEAVVMNHLRTLDSTEQSAHMNAVLSGIEAEQKDERDEAEKAKQKAEDRAFAVVKQVDDLIASALAQISRLKVPVDAVGKAVESQFRQLEAKRAEGQAQIGAQLADAYDSVTQLKDVMRERADTIYGKIQAKRDEMDHAQNLTKFGGADALQYVAQSVNDSLAEETLTETEVNDGVKPATEDFRVRVGQVFASMGIELDLESVAANAAADIDGQLSNKQKMLDAQAAAEARIKKIQDDAKAELKRTGDELNKEVANIMSMMHLSEHERSALIATAKAKADQTRQRVLAGVQAKISEQAHIGLGIDTKERTLQQLVAQAHSLVAGQFEVTPAHVIKQRFEALEGKTDKLRDTYITPAFGSSFLEEDARDEADAAAKDAAASRRVATAASAFRTIAQKVKSLSEQTDRADAHWEDVLTSLHSV